MTQKHFRLVLVLGTSLMMSLFTSCKKDVMNTTEVPKTIEDVILTAGIPQAVQNEDDSTVLNTDYDFAGNWLCKTIDVNATEARGDYRTFDPNSEVIWPGNLIQGNSITKATPDPIVVERAGGTFTINLINGSNSSTTQASVDKINQSNVVSALNTIIAGNSGAIPANFSYVMQEVESQEQLALAMGVNLHTLTTDVKTKLSFSSDKSYNRFLVDFTQIYYTMIYEKPTSYDQVFASSVTPEDLMPYMNENNPPVYISSVTYGRRYYLLLESTSSVEQMRASIKASYDAAVSGGSVSAGVKYVSDLSELNIKIFAMGGDANSALGAFNGDLTTLESYLQDGGDYLKAAPLSYVLTSLAPPQKQVSIGVYSTFTIQQCTPMYNVAPPEFMKGWYNLFDSVGIGAACAISPDQNNAYLFSKDGTKYAVSINGEINGVFDVQGSAGPLSGGPIDSIGSAVVFPNGALYFFDMSGLHYEALSQEGHWSGIIDLKYWGIDNTCPFREGARANPGVGACLNYSKDRIIMFDKDGQFWVLYNTSTGVFADVNPINTWGASNGPEWSIPFQGDGVGVALQVKTKNFIPNPHTGVVPDEIALLEVLFNHDGTKAAVYGGGVGFSPVYDLVPPKE